MRLGGSGSSPWEGYVEGLGSNGQWGGICDDNFDINDAHVICRMLRFPLATAALAYSTADDLYGTPPSNKFVLSNLNCTGSEDSIFDDCPHSIEWSEQCEKNEIAGVRCAKRML